MRELVEIAMASKRELKLKKRAKKRELGNERGLLMGLRPKGRNSHG